ncbi:MULTISPECIES: TetR/AcrR family transcriptional regulator [unclassified Gordonia (in: high G+C Gram-positive bacteria)]|uniref:TetR/AcrR family transcriptional regulator n=1 Tax=unclassified Gordonia (in: high G+C Gram-positive bacteria) TaxID=2657482 RepID=UPI001F0E1AE7|nr:TetR/AcrR family transcriptional regulator [Gordonia sp. ABSL49_1]MCH5643212.1 TetR/AcrR family transcriptional regulator [Gordonia sp. ABSL49_1]
MTDADSPWELPGNLDPTARKIVTAARIRFSESGFADTTMEDIAHAAGVGVATVYRRFGHRKRIVRYAIIDEAIRLGNLLSAAGASASGPEELVVETFTAFVHEASQPKLLTRNLRESGEAAELSAFLNDATIISLGRSTIATSLRPWQEAGRLPADLDLVIVGEMISRLMNSLIEAPDDSAIPIADPAAARRFAQTYLVPLLQATGR